MKVVIGIEPNCVLPGCIHDLEIVSHRHEVAGSHVWNRQSRCFGLDSYADLVQLGQVAGRDRRHHRGAPRELQHQALGDKSPNRVPDRYTTHPQRRRQLLLVKLGPRRQRPGQNPSAKLIEGLFSRRYRLALPAPWIPANAAPCRMYVYKS